MRPKIISLKNFLSICLFLLAFLSIAEESYRPRQANPLFDPWRWHRFDLLENQFIYCGAELPNSDLLFASEEGLIIYDGYQTELIPFPEPYQSAQTFAIWVEQPDRYYLNTSIGLLTYGKGKWDLVLEYSHYYPLARSFFAKNKDGLLVVGTPYGFFSLNNGKAEAIFQFEEATGVGCVLACGDELFFSPPRANKVYSCNFDKISIADPSSWKMTPLLPENWQGVYLLSGNKNREVYALNFYLDNGLYRVEGENKPWEKLNISANLEHTNLLGGISIGRDTLLIFAKSSIFVFEKGKWAELDRSQFKNPINGVFAFRRQNGNLIIGGRGESIMEVDFTPQRWDTLLGLHFICEDNNQRQWFISQENEIISHDIRTNDWIRYTDNVIDTPRTILCDRDGTIWVAGSHNHQAAVGRLENGKWVRELHPGLGDKISHLSAIQLKDGRVLFGSGEELPSVRMGLVVYEKQADGFIATTYGSPVVPERVASIAETDSGDIWVGGFGLAKIDPNFQQPMQTFNIEKAEWVDHIQPATGSKLYVGMWEKGLFIGDENGWKKIDNFHKQAGHLVSHMMIEQDNPQSLWVASDRKIAKLVNGNSISEMLPPDLSFIREEGTLAQSVDGSIWLNHTNRAWYFPVENNPRTIDDFYTVRYTPVSDPPKIEILDFEPKTTEPANIHIEWQGIDKWSETEKADLRYSFKVNDDAWSPYSNETKTILLNYSAGKHEFKLRVKDQDQNITELEAPLLLTVRPPVWKRPWFIISGLLILTVLGFLLYLLVRQRINHVVQLDELKLQFFTNMSHELRTPLMLIIGPLESLIERLPNSFDKTPAKTAYNNAKKMLHLVDQILEFRKIEYSGIETQLSQQDIVKDIQDQVTFHQPLTEEKSIQFVSSCSHETFEARYDSSKLERVFSNLISNAVKYTQPRGTIIVKSQIETNLEDNSIWLDVSVEDDGEGIGADKLNHIFEPFYRVKGDSGRRERGVGLGLPFVKSLLDSIDGSIHVESPTKIEGGQKRGSRFLIHFPLQRAISKQTETASDETLSDETPPTLGLDSSKKWVLIVEDEQEIREYISSELKEQFSVVTAENGLDGFKKAQSTIPDLILTDVRMPVMDGNELCKKIRAEETTSHIPIIVLTALKSTEHQLQTLETGADDFLSKPVSSKVLKLKISNAINSRELLQKKYQTELHESTHTPVKEVKPSIDEQFLSKTNNFIEEHLEDPFFDVENLATLLGMSRMTLYRKIKAITGESPSELIRVTRLKTAAKLLIEGNLNISEIADRTGYQDLSHFSSSFKKYYQSTPSQYIRNQKQA